MTLYVLNLIIYTIHNGMYKDLTKIKITNYFILLYILNIYLALYTYTSYFINNNINIIINNKYILQNLF